MDKAIKSLAGMFDGWGVALFSLIAVAFACVLSGLIGLERERKGYSAGLRTHILVALGSCLFTIVSAFAFQTVDENGVVSFQGDPNRIAAQVVSGLGFIGAGTILQNGISVKGLTTAATLWVAGAIGMACGMGLFMEAVIATAAALIVLIILRILENSPSARGVIRIAYVCPYGEKSLAKATEALDALDLKIKDVDIKSCVQDGAKCTKIILTVKVKEKDQALKAIEALNEAVQPLALEELKR